MDFKKENSKGKQVSINLIANLVALVINLGISFLLVPYVTENVGEEAYGFVTLGNNFVNYVTMITVSLNAMAGRFVTIAIHKKEYEKARKYYSSVFFSNLVIVSILIVPLAIIVWKLEYILNISPQIVWDVKILWMLIFFNLFISLIGTVFNISTFCVNRLDLSAKRNVEANILKMIIAFVLFSRFKPAVWYWGLAILIYGIYIFVANIYYSCKLIPEMYISKKDFEMKSVKEILKSGVWNSISRVGSVALTEFDVLLANLMINPQMMGIMALAKTLPSYVTTLTSSITNVFMPSLTIEYAKAKSNVEVLVKEVKMAVRVLLFFHCIIYGLLFGFFDCLYKVWMPSQMNNIDKIYAFGLISISGCFVSAVSSIVMNIFTVVNKLKWASLSIVITGFISLPVTIVLANMTGNELLRGYTIAGVSVIFVTIRCVFFLIPYAGICIGAKWYTFLSDILLNVSSIAISIFIALCVKYVFHPNVWSELIFASAVTVILIGCVAFIIVLPKKGKKMIIGKIMGVLHK